MNRTLINNTKSSSVSAKNQKRNSRISVNGYNNNKAALLTLSVEDEVLKPVKETFENLKTVEVRLIISLSLSLSLSFSFWIDVQVILVNDTYKYEK